MIECIKAYSNIEMTNRNKSNSNKKKRQFRNQNI